VPVLTVAHDRSCSQAVPGNVKTAQNPAATPTGAVGPRVDGAQGVRAFVAPRSLGSTAARLRSLPRHPRACVGCERLRAAHTLLAATLHVPFGARKERGSLDRGRWRYQSVRMVLRGLSLGWSGDVDEEDSDL